MLTLITNGYPLSEGSVKALKGYLEHHGIPVRAIYLNQARALYPALIRDIVALAADSRLIGFSLMSKDVRVFRPLIESFRQRGIPVALGGIHPTALPRESLALADYICRGEGEEPLRLLYEALGGSGRLEAIPNLGCHTAAGPLLQPVTWSPQRLDDLPLPDTRLLNSFLLTGARQGRHLIKIPSDPAARIPLFGHKGFMLYSQRGCRLACSYCSNSLYRDLLAPTGQRWYRTLSVQRIKETVRALHQALPTAGHFTINDDDFLDRDPAELQAIAAFLHDEMGLAFNINATPRHVTDEKIGLLARYGLREVAMGVQTGSERILKALYHRPVPPEQILRAARILERYRGQGVRVSYGFILDNPYEAAPDWLASLKLLRALPRPHDILFYSLTMFPGTRLTERACRDGIIAGPAIDCDKAYHDDLQASFINGLFLLNARWRLPGWLHRLLTGRWLLSHPAAVPLRVLGGGLLLALTARSRLTRRLRRLASRTRRLRATAWGPGVHPGPVDPLPVVPPAPPETQLAPAPSRPVSLHRC